MSQISRWRILSTKAAKRVQITLKNRIRRRVCHTDLWPDPTWQKSLIPWPVTRKPGSNTALRLLVYQLHRWSLA